MPTANVALETLRMTVPLGTRCRVGFAGGRVAEVSKVVRLEEAAELLEEEVGVG